MRVSPKTLMHVTYSFIHHSFIQFSKRLVAHETEIIHMEQ